MNASSPVGFNDHRAVGASQPSVHNAVRKANQVRGKTAASYMRYLPDSDTRQTLEIVEYRIAETRTAAIMRAVGAYREEWVFDRRNRGRRRFASQSFEIDGSQFFVIVKFEPIEVRIRFTAERHKASQRLRTLVGLLY